MPNRLPRLLFIAFAASLALAPTAAADTTTNCAGLQGVLFAAAPGDTITLNEMCTISNSGGAFTLPSIPITLRAQAGSGAGFDGTGVLGRMLFGTDVGLTTISGLIFQDGTALVNQPGGAIRITGVSTPTLDSDQFYNNTAPSGSGGAVSVASTFSGSTPVAISNSTFGDVGRSNTAPASGAQGGAVSINSPNAPVVISNSHFVANQSGSVGGGLLVSTGSLGPVTMTANLFQGNSAGAVGGGATIGSGGAQTLTGNQFISNHVNDAADPIGFGGGLVMGGNGVPPPPFSSTGNVFDSNTVNFKTTGDSIGQGGGALIENVVLDSHNDSFTNNTLQGPSGNGEAEGSGLSYESCASTNVTSRATQLVVAGNQSGAGAAAEGALYIGCATGNAHLALFDSTVSGNSGGAGSTAGAWGDPADDTLDLTNTILAGNSGGADLGGFQSVSATFSDLCSGAAPFAGAGNICAAPKLVGGADVRQTDTSPTIDAGSNALIPAGLTTDYAGNSRTVDFRGGGAIVDIGAQEAPPASLSGSELTLEIPKSGKIGSSLKATVGCKLAFSGTCVGDLSAVALLKIRGKAISSKRHKKKKKTRKVKLALGSVKFSVIQGKTVTATIAVPKKARRKLAKLRSANVALTGSFHVGASKAATSSKTGRYKIAKKKKKRKHHRR